MDDLNQKIDAYIDSLVSEILSLPALQDLTDQEKKEHTLKLQNHFSNLILQTALNRMSSEQIADLQNNIENPDVMEKKIEEYSSLIPGLADDIEARLQREFEMMKKTLSITPV